MKHALWLVTTFWLLAGTGLALGQVSGPEQPPVFDSPLQEERYRELLKELRCPKCQNQALADSDAPLAKDLRAEILRQLKAGRTDEEIRNFLVARYNDFVLYKPPLQANTVLLWVAPFALLVIGSAVLVVSVARRRRAVDEAEGA